MIFPNIENNVCSDLNKNIQPARKTEMGDREMPKSKNKNKNKNTNKTKNCKLTQKNPMNRFLINHQEKDSLDRNQTTFNSMNGFKTTAFQ
jgi:hypothetical protein